jgi:plastocyanin
MRRPIVALLAVSGLVGVPAGPAAASGGGGCGAPTTEGAGDAVSISGFCFEPTVLYTEPGARVTFQNLDPVRHNVLGAQGEWGSFEWLREGRSVSHGFAESGVYPYVCTWHPGMVGAVVVGDPPGAFSAEPVARITEAPGTEGRWKAVAGVALGLLLLTLVAAGARRKPTP